MIRQMTLQGRHPGALVELYSLPCQRHLAYGTGAIIPGIGEAFQRAEEAWKAGSALLLGNRPKGA